MCKSTLLTCGVNPLMHRSVLCLYLTNRLMPVRVLAIDRALLLMPEIIGALPNLGFPVRRPLYANGFFHYFVGKHYVASLSAD